MDSNAAVLTAHHAAISAKKRAKKNQIDLILFDDDARRDYLTGFHKRNLVKKEAAKQKAILKERQQRLEARREQRKALKEQAAENAALVEKAYRRDHSDAEGDQDNDDDDSGHASSSDLGSSAQGHRAKDRQKQEAFEDEEQLATVTVVEEFDPDSLLHDTHLSPSQQHLEESSSHSASIHFPPTHRRSHPAPRKSSTRELRQTSSSHDHSRTHTASSTMTKKKQTKNFTYETKAARQAEKRKQKRRKLEKAGRAEGKATRLTGSRRSNGGKKR